MTQARESNTRAKLAKHPLFWAIGSILRGRWSRVADHERHVDIEFMKEKGRIPHDDEERRRWCIAKNLEQQVRGR